MTDHDPSAWRNRFPILDDCTYLVTHSLGAMPLGVEDKLAGFTRQWATRGVRAGAEGCWDAPGDVGDLLARMVNATAGSVISPPDLSG